MSLVGGLYAIAPPVQIATSQEHLHKPRTKKPNLAQKDSPPRIKKLTAEDGFNSTVWDTPGTVPNCASRTRSTCA